jgi:transcriptional regulator with XRE-family HTH domain
VLNANGFDFTGLWLTLSKSRYRYRKVDIDAHSAMIPLDKLRRYVADRVRHLRQDRKLSQAALAKRLGLSQARLSEIERGDGSFSAEQFITLLGLFNATVADFVPKRSKPNVEDDLQNTLARLGANHLLESPELVPGERVDSAATAIRDTLVLAKSPRLITALAPVLVQNIDAINVHQVNAELAQAGLQRRFGWLVENTAAAVVHVRQKAPRSLAAKYRGAEVILGNFLGLAYSELQVPEDPKLGFDVLDRNIRSRRTLQEVIEASSPISMRWRVATSIQPDDFETALRAAHDIP